MIDVERAVELLGIAPVKRHGARLWAERCPMPGHGVQNPSHRYANWFVRIGTERLGQHHCYSCKQGGTISDLVMAILGCTFDEARTWLSDLGEAEPAPFLEIRYRPISAASRAFRLPAGVERPPLSEWNSVPMAYARSRGITDEQLERWRVGYALEGRLSGRLVFPVVDARARLGNYAARTFVGDEKRYLSAAEWEHPDRSALMGEERWPPQELRRGVVLFEGAVNGLAIERALAGTRVPVCLAGMSGSSFDALKAAKLATFRRVAVATDPDDAGDHAASLAAMGLARSSEVRRVIFPRRGADAADTSPELLRDAILAALA